MNEVLTEALRVWREEGLERFLVETVQFTYRKTLRRLLPIQRYALWNGVRMPPDVAHKRRLGDGLLTRGWHLSDIPQSEGGEVKAHKAFTEANHRVIIIGGGRGVTAVHAARQSAPDGEVEVYEAGAEYAELLQRVFELNAVTDRCAVIHASVGSPIKVYGEVEDDPKRLDPGDLPRCDVLELDCEGAELGILQSLEITPRVIIVEMHPKEFDAPPDAVLDILETNGYDIVGRWSNPGDEISQEELASLLGQNRQGKAPAPVVAAVRSDR